MDIAKLYDLKLTDSGPISHHHRQNRSYSSVGISGSHDNEGILVINRNLNYYNNQDQDVSHLQQLDDWGVGRDEQQKNGRSNQFASSKSQLNSHENFRNQQLRGHNENNETALILTPILRETKKSIENQQQQSLPLENATELSLCKEKYFLHDQEQQGDNVNYYHQQYHQNGEKVLDGDGNNCNHKLGSHHNNTSWDRIFQCFSVFKPRKISSTNPTSTLCTEVKETKASDKFQNPQLRKTMTDLDLYLQELADASEILDRVDTSNLGKNFPPRAIGNSWEKTFSTTTDGFSLHNLYRKLDGFDSPVIFVIEDIENRVFGAVLSCGFKVSENFYGNCETFLFRCRPEFEVFKWSGDNFYFIQGQDGFISVGCDDGRHGLWLDDNLFLGRTEKCSTFNSPPLVPEQDFKIKTVECWTVGLY